jgi:hypothetical protein
VLELELMREIGVLVAEPEGPLAAEDFDRMAALLDPYLDQAGRLKGLLVDTRRLPGWDGLPGLLAHERFLRGHAPRIDRVAIVTDSDAAGLLAWMADLALAPQVRRFAWSERHAAMDWLAGSAAPA